MDTLLKKGSEIGSVNGISEFKKFVNNEFHKKISEEVIQITKKIDDTLIEKVINHLKSVKKLVVEFFLVWVVVLELVMLLMILEKL